MRLDLSRIECTQSDALHCPARGQALLATVGEQALMIVWANLQNTKI